MVECLVHDILINDNKVRNYVADILNIENEKMQLIHEDTYINGISADFTLLYDNKIRALIECKAGNIGVTDYVRGIGQLFQYEYYNEKKVSPKGFQYDSNFNTLYIFPSSVIRNNQFNIGRFKYPKSMLILELNENNYVIRKIQKEELIKLEEAQLNDLVTISQYYVRDNRIFELYILLRYLAYKKIIGVKSCDRKNVENNFLRKLETPNNRNWRNAFISLSSLGLIDSNSLPTDSGIMLANLSYEDFLVDMYNSYIKPYVDLIMEAITEENMNNQQILDKIRELYNGRDVLFLTESAGRYISSWMNILRDDFGCIDFQSRSSNRKIIYMPNQLNEESLKHMIKENNHADLYIERYLENLKEEV